MDSFFLFIFFDRAESFDFDEVQFINLFIYGYASYLRNLYLTQATKISSMFSSRSVVVLGFIFRSVIHFGLNFV